MKLRKNLIEVYGTFIIAKEVINRGKYIITTKLSVKTSGNILCSNHDFPDVTIWNKLG
jgi:hypothetical protein